MSEDDGFVREVTADVQRERLAQFSRKYGRLIGICVGVVILGASTYAYWSYSHTKAAEAFGATLLTTSQIEEEDERVKAYTDITQEYSGDLRSILAHMRTPTSDSKDINTGDLLYDDALTLSSLYREIDTLAAEDAIKRLEPLTLEDRPFRLAAMELLASVYIRESRLADAKALYRKIATTPSTPPSMRSRATYMQQVYADIADKPEDSEPDSEEDQQ